MAAPSATRPVVATTSATAAAKPSAPVLKTRRIFWENLKPAMCVRDTGTDLTLATVVDCRSDHQVEVIAHTALAGPKKWPGDTAVDYYTADQARWQAGDHTLICLVLDPDNQNLTRALRGANE